MDVITAVLERMLRSKLSLMQVSNVVFDSGPGALDQVVSTCRFILILEGSLTYTIEERDYFLHKGMQFLVPAWCRRSWRVKGSEKCHLVWCEFDDDPQELGQPRCYLRELSGGGFDREQQAYGELLQFWQRRDHLTGDEEYLNGLVLEGQLKAMLARFWPEAEETLHKVRQEVRVLHPDIKKTLRWLERHYTDSDVLEQLPLQVELSPNYQRRLFRELMGCSLSEYVKRMRLRHARYLLHTTTWQLKRIAIEVGYTDPLYFSRVYRHFWGNAPRLERIFRR